MLLCLIAGGPAAFLALEVIGIPIVAVLLVTLILVGRRHHTLPEMLIGFGSTYAIEIFRIAVPWVITSLQHNELPTAAYFGAHLVAAIAVLGAGIWLLGFRRPAASPVGR